jgi:hypothetical protein
MKFEVKSADLFRVMNDALQFASPAGIAPAIESVRIETTPNDAETVNLIGVATDRFVLGASRVTAQGDAGIGLALSTDDVKNVLRIAKTVRRDESHRRVTVEVDADTLAAEMQRKRYEQAAGARVVFTFSTGETITVNTISADFPRWRQLLTADIDAMAQPTSGLGVDPLKVAQFAKIAAAKRSPMQLFAGITTAGGLKPVHVRIGDDFYGLIMPIRSPGGGLFAYESPGWLSA